MFVDRSLSAILAKVLVGLFIALALSAIFYWGAIYFKGHMHRDPEVFYGTLLEIPRNSPNFDLVGIDGKPYTQDALKGQWTWMFFGFTHCGSICPVTMAKLAKFYQQLQEKNIMPLPKIIFITLDPEQDSLERLKHYVQSYQENFFAARGSEVQIEQLTHALGVAYMQATDQQPIEHSGTLMVFNPEGKLAAFFTPPHKVKHWVSDYQTLVGTEK